MQFNDWPSEPDPALLPRYGDRRLLEAIHVRYYGPASRRSFEVWPPTWRQSNGRAVTLVADFIAEAERRFAASPPVRGGRRGRQPERAEA